MEGYLEVHRSNRASVNPINKIVLYKSNELIRISKAPEEDAIGSILLQLYTSGRGYITVAFVHPYIYQNCAKPLGRIAKVTGFKKYRFFINVTNGQVPSKVPRVHSRRLLYTGY